MRPKLLHATVVGDHRLKLEYADGLVALLDFAPFFVERRGPLVEPLKSASGFATAHIDHGALTWATGYDVCPDVLRSWCERGRICSPDETSISSASPRPLHAS
jgi:hypothetical protein